MTFAHRGARSERPENTLDAFRRARELGASGLETDAWLSADGAVVLVHDDSVRRGLRRVRVERTPAAELATFGVPTLDQLYEACGTEFELSVDVKASDAAAAAARVAREAGSAAPGRLWLCSPSFKRLVAWREPLSDVRLVHSPGRRGIVPAALERHASDLERAGLDALNLHHLDWTKGVVSLLHRFGLGAFAWDTQETRHLLAALRMGVDGVYCDRVDRMVACVGEWIVEGRPGA